jgi:acetoacetate decarboxylase
MTEQEVKERAYAMPLTSPAFPPGPYRFVNREFFIITYRTDPDALRAVVPAPLEFTQPLVKYEFIRMPDSTGFGDYTESGQVIPVRFQGREGGYVHAMYLDDESPFAGGASCGAFPRSSRRRSSPVEKDTLLGVLRYGPVPVAVATMGFKHRTLANDKIAASLRCAEFLLKIIPHVDGGARVCELVRYFCEDITVKGAWEGPAALELFHHALAPVAGCLCSKVVSGVHILTDLTLGLGTVVHDYLRK